MKSHKIVRKKNLSESVNNNHQEDLEKAAKEMQERRKQSLEYALDAFCVKYCFKNKKEVEKIRKTTDENGQPSEIKEKVTIYPFNYNLLLEVATNIIHRFRTSYDILPNKCALKLQFSEENKKIYLYRTYDNTAVIQKSKLPDWYINHIKDDSLFAASEAKKLIIAYLTDTRFPVKLNDEEQRKIAYILMNKPNILMGISESVNNAVGNASVNNVLPDDEDLKWLHLLGSYDHYWQTERGRKDTQAYLKDVFKTLGTDKFIERLNGTDTEKLFNLVQNEISAELRAISKHYKYRNRINESFKKDIENVDLETLHSQADESISPYNEIAEDIIKTYNIQQERKRKQTGYVSEEFEDPDNSDEVENIYEKFDKIAPIEDKLNLLSKIHPAALYNGSCLMGNIAKTISESNLKPKREYIQEMSTFSFY